MKQFLYSAVASAALFSSTVFADDAQMLQQQLQNLDSLSSAFSQQVFDPQGQLVSESKGKLQLEQPRKIRWEQQQPDETLFVSNGVDSYYFDPFAEQVTVLDTSKLIDNTPFILLTTEDDELWQQFSIKQIEAGFEITPKNTEDAQVEKLTLHFDEQQKLRRLRCLTNQVSVHTFILMRPSAMLILMTACLNLPFLSTCLLMISERHKPR